MNKVSKSIGRKIAAKMASDKQAQKDQQAARIASRPERRAKLKADGTTAAEAFQNRRKAERKPINPRIRSALDAGGGGGEQIAQAKNQMAGVPGTGEQMAPAPQKQATPAAPAQQPPPSRRGFGISDRAKVATPQQSSPRGRSGIGARVKLPPLGATAKTATPSVPRRARRPSNFNPASNSQGGDGGGGDFKKGGSVSARADGIAIKGKTRGKMV